MPQFQVLTGYINLGGERGNVVFRGPDNPITYPESLILQVIHGGQEHVHTLVEIGEVEREHFEEFDRLTQKYGAVAKAAFPAVGGKVSLPQRDDALPTAEQVKAAKEAAAEAMAAAKAGKKAKPAAKKAAEPEPDAAGVPSLDQLPK